MKRLIVVFMLLIGLVSGVVGVRYLHGVVQRPPRVETEMPLFHGVTYSRHVHNEPRRFVYHLVTIDLSAEGIEFVVTPPDRLDDRLQMDARRTSDFVADTGVQLAINASFFYPFHEHHPWDFYPREGEPVSILGYNIADEVQVSAEDESYYTGLCFTGTRPLIAEEGCPADTENAVSGKWVYVRDGESTIAQNHWSKPQPRTVAAFSNSAQKMWFIVVDGRQPGYSDGMQMLEMSNLSVALGAEWAVNLDGGGSSTLVANLGDGPELLNSPVHTRLPMRERPVGNHLGIRALPLQNFAEK